MRNDNQNAKEVISITWKGSLKAFSIIKILKNFPSNRRQKKYWKDKAKENEFMKKRGTISWKEFTKKLSNYQELTYTNDYDHKLMNKLAKKFNMKITTKYDKVEEKVTVLIAGGSPEKIDHFTKVYQKEFQRIQKQKDKARDFKEFRENKKAEREKAKEQERTGNREEYKKKEKEKGKTKYQKSNKDFEKDKDIDNDGVVDRADIDPNRHEVSDFKDLSIKNKANAKELTEIER